MTVILMQVFICSSKTQITLSKSSLAQQLKVEPEKIVYRINIQPQPLILINIAKTLKQGRLHAYEGHPLWKVTMPVSLALVETFDDQDLD